MNLFISCILNVSKEGEYIFVKDIERHAKPRGSGEHEKFKN